MVPNGDITMDIWKHEMVGVSLTKKEVETVLEDYIFSKYPELKNEKVWSWEDFNIHYDNKMGEDSICCESHFTKHDHEFKTNPEPKQLDIFDTRMKCFSGCSCSNSDICR